MFHAVIHLDHHQAQVLHFDAHSVHTEKFESHRHVTRQHGSQVRDVHEFFAEVCAALEGTAEVLVTGPHTALSDLRHYVEKHAPALAPHLVGFQPVDHLSPGQLLALAREFFGKHDRMAGVPTPN